MVIQASSIYSKGLLCLTILCHYFYGNNCNSIVNSEDAGPIVKTLSGSIIGKNLKILDTEVEVFLGIPYAEPPVKQNRYLKPKPAEHWEGVLDATKYTPPCKQHSTKNFPWSGERNTSEDCLYLNIWKPAKSSNKLPVMVWIYGGGFYAGYTDPDFYDGSFIVSLGNVIVVSMNYRVGSFGFLNAGNDKAAGNMGLQDQNFALQWVKNNIENFGGDANSITLFGESAGGASVSFHMVSPMSKVLFKRAIIQSNTFLTNLLLDDSETAYSKANALAKAVGCTDGSSRIQSNPEIIECLKKTDAMKLAKADDKLTGISFFIASYENEFLPINPLRIISKGNLEQKDLLLGSNLLEGAIFLNEMYPHLLPSDSGPILNLTSARNIIEEVFESMPSPPINDVFQKYFKGLTENDSAQIAKALSLVLGDYGFSCSVKLYGEKMKSYMYWFTHKSVKMNRAEWMSVTHFDEVPYVFGLPFRDSSKYSEEDREVSRDIIQKWTDFAKTGHPLGDKSSENWPIYTADSPDAYVLDAGPGGVLPYPRAEACEYWRPYLDPKFN